MTLGAATVQGTAGFAFGLIAMPAYLWILGSADAVPLVIILNLAICAVLVARIHRSVEGGLLRPFVLGAIAGLPLGLIAFRRAETDHLLVAIAAAILAFVVLVSVRESRPFPPPGGAGFSSAPAVGVGALAGGMTIALGMPGPPIMLYMTGIGIAKDTVRATALGFFVISYAAALALQTMTVGVGGGVWITAGVLLPVAGAGGLIGNGLSRYVSEERFRRAVLALLALIGVSTLIGVLLR